MAANQTQRPQFFEEQYLGAADLTAAIDYGRLQDARHALGAHTWGIAAGLQLTEKASPGGGGQVDVHIQPGYAWDGFGRTILVLSPRKIEAELFKSITYDAALDGGTPPGRLIKVWLRYDESATRQPPPGFQGCDDADRFSRIQETFRVEIGERLGHPDRHAPISVAGYAIDAQETLQKLDPQTPPVALHDESVPYQHFPSDNPKARWLIPLGAVRWQPNPVANQPGHFVQREDADTRYSRTLRRHIGVVAAVVEAADGVIRLHDRLKPYSGVLSSDLVWIEGHLRVEGDARLFAGKLDFRDQNGLDNNGIPLLLQRVDVTGASGSLQAVIGKADQGANAFAVGPLNNLNQFTSRLIVRDDGKVGIRTAAPTRTLHVVGDRIRLESDDASKRLDMRVDGGAVDLHSETTSLYLRSSGSGTNNRVIINPFAADGNVGIGLEQPDYKLDVADRMRVRQGAAGSAGIWFLQGGSDRAFVGMAADDQVGFWGQALSDFGLVMNTTNGNVGIGTRSPGVRLDVNNRMRLRDGPTGSAGTWLFQSGPNADRGFMGMANDDLLGWWGYGSGWGMVMQASNGFVGLGTLNPAARLHLSGSGNQYLDISCTDRPSYTRLMAVTSNGITESQLQFRNRLSLVAPLPGDPTTAYAILRIEENGDIHVRRDAYKPGGGHWSNPSDERLKKDITPLSGSLSKMLQLRGVRFLYKEPENMGNLTGPQVGLIAQEVEKVFPEWVSEGPDGYKAVTLRGFEALTIEALRELKTEIETVRAQSQKSGVTLGQALALEAIRELKAEIDTVKTRLDKPGRLQPTRKARKTKP